MWSWCRCSKSFQSLERLSADTLNLEARPAGTHWLHQGTRLHLHVNTGVHDMSDDEGCECADPVYLLKQVKRRRRLSEVSVAPWPPSPATNLWRAWSPTSIWQVLRQRWAVRASRLHRDWRAGQHRARQPSQYSCYQFAVYKCALNNVSFTS